MKSTINLAPLAAALLVAPAAFGAVKLPAVLGDGAVVQREMPIPVWGTADPGETFTVKLGKGKGVTATTAPDGTWAVELPAMKAGGPYTLTAGDASSADILVGDIYLCSGQSNMELPINRVNDMFAADVAAYSNPNIREFKTPKEPSFTPEGDVNGSAVHWKRADDPADTQAFGALVYFIGRELYEQNGGVPVGIVNSSWGGTHIEAWMSADALSRWPEKMSAFAVADDADYRARLSAAERERSGRWNARLNATDLGNAGQQPWSAAALDDSGWSEVELLGRDWGRDSAGPVNGVHWLRREVIIPADKAGQEATLRLGCIVDADSAWVNGQFVGFTAYQYPPRIYKVPAGVLHEGKNSVAVRVVSNGGVPHVVPEKPHKLIFADSSEVSLEGKWRHKLGCRMPQAPGSTDFFQTPTVLYNSMIAPMARLPFRGVVWYQGESDVDNRSSYATLLSTMMNDWRHTFNNPELPFYIVELADFLHPSDTYGRKAWAEMRAAQLQATEMTPGATLIKNSDCGEWNDIHPLDKLTPARRCAAAILAK